MAYSYNIAEMLRRICNNKPKVSVLRILNKFIIKLPRLLQLELILLSSSSVVNINLQVYLLDQTSSFLSPTSCGNFCLSWFKMLDLYFSLQ